MPPVPRRQLFLLFALPLVGCASQQPPPSTASPLLGKPLPKFRRTALQGQSVDTTALRGHVVVVKFFAEYCKPCQRTLPAAEALHAKFHDVRWIGVSEDESLAQAHAQISRYGLTFPIVHDRGNVLAGRFRTTEMPTTFVADASGTIIWVGGENQRDADLERAIAAAR